MMDCCRRLFPKRRTIWFIGLEHVNIAPIVQRFIEEENEEGFNNGRVKFTAVEWKHHPNMARAEWFVKMGESEVHGIIFVVPTDMESARLSIKAIRTLFNGNAFGYSPLLILIDDGSAAVEDGVVGTLETVFDDKSPYRRPRQFRVFRSTTEFRQGFEWLSRCV